MGTIHRDDRIKTSFDPTIWRKKINTCLNHIKRAISDDLFQIRILTKDSGVQELELGKGKAERKSREFGTLDVEAIHVDVGDHAGIFRLRPGDRHPPRPSPQAPSPVPIYFSAHVPNQFKRE